MGTKTLTGNWSRATPRREPWEQTATVRIQPFGHVSMPRRLSATRAAKRQRQHDRYRFNLAMFHALGQDPVYVNSPYQPVGRKDARHVAYVKAVRAWQIEHRPRHDG